MYLEAITLSDNDSANFDPKDKQKAVYRWYDSRYSDEALDIYSKEWQHRILTWYQAHQPATEERNGPLTSEERLERLPFGNFFLAHPIAAFSLWRVLQALYDLDRAVCGDTAEVASWQQLPPFKYLRDSSVQERWKAELQRLKGDVQNRTATFAKHSWETRMRQILLSTESVEQEFAALKDNFGVNLVDMKFSLWMEDRIEEDVFGARFSMITEVLNFKKSELQNMHQVESNEERTPTDLSSMPKPSRAPTFPPAYPSPVITKPSQKKISTSAQAHGHKTTLVSLPAKSGGILSSLRSQVKGIKHKMRNSKRPRQEPIELVDHPRSNQLLMS